jgi:dTMP kinase
MNTQSVRNPVHRQLIVLDYFLSTVIKIKIPLMRGRNIVCDRYVYDLQADLLRQHKRTGRILRRLLPKPDKVFLIDLPEEVAFKRKNDVPSIDYLTQRRGGFLDLAKQYNMTVLDGSKPLKELRSQITVGTEPLIKGGGDD